MDVSELFEKDLTRDQSQWLWDRMGEEESRVRDSKSFGDDAAALYHQTRHDVFYALATGELRCDPESPELLALGLGFDWAGDLNADDVFSDLRDMERSVAAYSAFADLHSQRPDILAVWYGREPKAPDEGKE